MEIQDWIINWFTENTLIERDILLNGLKSNYFENGWIDSMKFISFLTDLEQQFRIEFSGGDFEDRNFSTISGLAEIIGAKLL
jgi:acyl carrier protein